jgi:hypothetical protein
MLSNTCKLILLLLVFNGCATPASRTKTFDISSAKFRAQVPQAGERGILISCIRCNCFYPVVGEFIKHTSNKYPRLYIAADTACGQFSSVNYIRQANLDAISEDWYNVILFKTENQRILCRIVETAESKNFNDICQQFFLQ